MHWHCLAVRVGGAAVRTRRPLAVVGITRQESSKLRGHDGTSRIVITHVLHVEMPGELANAAASCLLSCHQLHKPNISTIMISLDGVKNNVQAIQNSNRH